MNTVGADGSTCASEECALSTGQGGSLGITLSIGQGSRLAIVAQQRLIEHFHQFCATGIVYFPECWQKRSRSSIEETAPQADHFIHSPNDSTSRLTGA